MTPEKKALRRLLIAIFMTGKTYAMGKHVRDTIDDAKLLFTHEELRNLTTDQVNDVIRGDM